MTNMQDLLDYLTNLETLILENQNLLEKMIVKYKGEKKMTDKFEYAKDINNLRIWILLVQINTILVIREAKRKNIIDFVLEDSYLNIYNTMFNKFEKIIV